MTDAEFAAFLAGGMDRSTVTGALGSDTQGFSINGLSISSTDAVNDGAVIEAPPNGG